MTADEELKAKASSDEVEAVWRLATALSGSLTPTQLAEALQNEGGRAAGGAFAHLALVHERSGLVQVASPTSEGRQPGVQWTDLDPEAQAPARDAIRGGLPVLLGSFAEVANRYPGLIQGDEGVGLGAWASLPLHSARGPVLGVVEFSWRVPQAFEAAQLRLLELIAVLTGLALERATSGAFSPALAERGPSGLETMPGAFFSLDGELRITYINVEGERALRAYRSELLGKKLFDLFPGALGSAFELQYRHSLGTGRPVAFEEYYGPSDSWYEVHAWPDSDGVNVSFWDINERRRGEVRRSEAMRQTELAHANLKFLSELSSSLRGATTRVEVFECLARAVVPTMADWCTLVVPQGDELVRLAAVHRDPALDPLAKRLVGAYPHPFSGPSPGVPVYRTGQPMRLPKLAQHIVAGLDDSAASTAYGRTLVLLGDAGLIMPVHAHDEVAAVLTMVRSSGREFSDDDVDFMWEVVACVATGLDNARYIEDQRATAGVLQDAVLPKSLPNIANLELAAGYRAASEGGQVGGDWYDAFELPNGCIALAVGDAAGHGLQAAALMAQMRNALRAYLFASLGPAEALASLRRLLAIQEPEAFATAVCAEVNPVTGETRWASAGHPAPVLVQSDGKSAYLRGQPAPPIGWAVGGSVPAGPEHPLSLSPGDRLMLFTDGLVERRGINLDIGLTHLMILAEQTHRSPAQAACDAVFQDIQFASHEDDVCLLIADMLPR